MQDTRYEKACKETEEKIKAIGQEIIDRADKIVQDLEGVMSITIHGKIEKDSVTTLEITKEFCVTNSENMVI